jgi:hypothetical protein
VEHRKWNKKGGTQQAEQDRQNKTGRTIQAEQENKNKTNRMGLKGLPEREDRTLRTSRTGCKDHGCLDKMP